ncbi:MAG TPA: efflux RND transporter periplasmic adaptor subunit [Parachlamydiaceae bacterium]|nr:efflux RND transporter periplasmic adaptor subunit [Parachlamydiaceae bacterium]
MAANEEGNLNGNGNRIKTVFRFFIILIISVLIGFIYWFFFLRNYVSTDDAYVNGYTVNLTSEVSSIVTSFYADNSDFVKKGQLLVQLDLTDFQLKFEKTANDLALAVRQVVQLKQDFLQAKASYVAQKAKYRKAIIDFENRKNLVEDLAVTHEDYEHSKIAVDSEKALLHFFRHKVIAARSALGVTTLEEHPLVENARTNFNQAYINLQRTSIYAPVNGFIAKRSVEVGKWVNPKDVMMAIISLDDVWVDANFKETQISHIRVGQKVNAISDIYGRSVPFKGTVLGLVPGSGSVFSFLPPQNATGNWIKIVQRIPVRILLDKEELKKNPLLLGLSIYATVDISDDSGLFLREATPLQAVVSTSIYDLNLDEAKKQADQIIADNR